MNTDEKLQVMLTPPVLAERWSASTGRLANMRCAGTGPTYVKIGELVRYRLCDVEGYEQAHAVTRSGERNQ